MITILKIKFNSEKQYTYKLAPGSKAIPKAGDTLRSFSGASRASAFYTPMTVVDVYETTAVPAIVSKQIKVVDFTLKCVVECLPAPLIPSALGKGVPPKKAIDDKVPAHLKYWQHTFIKFASDFRNGKQTKKGERKCQHAKKKY